SQVLVARVVTRRHRRRLDLDRHRRVGEAFTEGDLARDRGEAAADAGEAEVTAHERDLGVTRIDGPDAGARHVDAVDDAGGGGGHGRAPPPGRYGRTRALSQMCAH